MSMMKKRVYCFSLLALSFFGSSHSLYASQSVGTIDSAYYSSRVCHDDGCTSYGELNFRPTGAPSPIAITDTGITGYAWGNEMGWINFQPSGAGVTLNPTTGELSGNAWSQTSGWVNFRPTNSGTLSGGLPIGVSITNSGELYGWAWNGGAYGGWIKFDCSSNATCVKTDWRKLGLRSSTQTTRYAASQFFSDSPYASKSSLPSQIGQMSNLSISSTTLSVTTLATSSQASSTGEIQRLPFITKTLRITNKTKEVTTLQMILALDKEIYPSGLVTGYFGTGTKKAVQLFQIKYGIAKKVRLVLVL
jgi:hypothetical protein